MCKACIHIMIELVQGMPACTYMNVPMRVRCIITFTMLIQWENVNDCMNAVSL